MQTEELKLSQVTVNSSNPRTISTEKFDKLINSILIFPKMLELRPVVIDDMMVVLGGNMRYRALSAISEMSAAEINMKLAHGCKGYAQKTEAERQNLRDYWKAWLENPTVTIVRADQLSEEQKREFIIKDNVGYGEWDMDMLANEWPAEDLDDWGLDVWQEPTDSEGGGMETNSAKEGSKDGSLNERFVVPPFSILDTRKGYWQARKKLWRDIIGDMGESRNDTLITSPEIKYKDLYLKTRKHREELGITFKEYLEKYVSDEVKEREASKVLSAGVSLLDPVMAEIVCKWFGTQGCKTFDCFAGDSVFGYVSAYLGNDFTGVELRPEQAELNNTRVAGMTARYINDDGQNVGKHIAPNSQDLLFSCPPYFDLEVYSDLPNDASNQGSYEDFIGILRNAFTAALGCLKDDRFAVIVVGDVRNKKTGCYYDFCGDIKRIFRDNGAELYNEIILVETGASTALRAGRYMESRKVAKMHQNILVFYKGNTKNIKTNFPKIEYASEDLEQFRVDSGNEPDGDTE